MKRGSGRIFPGNLLLLLITAFCLPFLWKTDFLWLEALLLVVALIAAKRLNFGDRPPLWLGPLRRASRNPALAFLIPALLSILLRIALLPAIPIPNPVVPDEYSHILLAKTLLLGRLANPPHPLWQHFESIHILSQPTYSSMYMAGQACFLALGDLIAGNLFWGVVLSTALFCGALTWFLRAYVPAGWALYGGVLAAVRIGAASYWNDSYWGGSAGALGAALALGGYARLVRQWRAHHAIIFAAGLVLLANTRPYEGAVLGAVLVAGLALEWFRAGKKPYQRLAWSTVAALVVLGVSAWAMTQYFKAVTGSALTMPYQVNQRTYGWPMTLVWLPVRSVEYRFPEFALYRDFELEEHRLSTDPKFLLAGLLLKYTYQWRFFFGFCLSAGFLFVPLILKNRRMRMPWIAAGAVCLAAFTEQSAYPHYLAPAGPVFFLFAIQGLRYLSHCRARSAPLGPAIVYASLPIFCILIGVRAAVISPYSRPTEPPNFFSWCCTDVRSRDREPIVRKLEAEPGRQLVIVHYDLSKYDTSEWVYNDPDIDHARIVFARDMGDQKNQELFRYYPNRTRWKLVVADHGQAQLTPY